MIAEIDGAIRGLYPTGRVADFVTLTESAVVSAGGTVTGRNRSADSPSVQARFVVGGRASRVVVSLTSSGLTVMAYPD